MHVELDGKSYEVPEAYQEKLIGQLWGLVLKEYEKVPTKYRVMAKPLVRTVLYEMEKNLAKEHGPEVAAQVARPPKGEDPNTHLLWIMSKVLREGIGNAIFIIDTEETGDIITAFNISFPNSRDGGGSLASDGDIGIGENDRGETPGYSPRPSVPEV